MKTTDSITNREDIIDSRDIIHRIEFLRGEFDSLCAAINEAETDEERTSARAALTEWLGTGEELPETLDALVLKDFADSDDADELIALEALAEQCEGYGDWQYGETLIRDSYFTEYAQQLAKDIGAIDRDGKWPMGHIDWEAAADALKANYTTVDFNGTEYFMRA